MMMTSSVDYRQHCKKESNVTLTSSIYGTGRGNALTLWGDLYKYTMYVVSCSKFTVY